MRILAFNATHPHAGAQIPGLRAGAVAALLMAGVLAATVAGSARAAPAPEAEPNAGPAVAASVAAPGTAQAASAVPAPVPATGGAASDATGPAGGAGAATAKDKVANEQVIEPQVDRRDVRVPHIPSNDYELGLFTGTYDTQNFGASFLAGLRAGYHITEDVFVEAVYGQTKVSDQDFRLILPGGIFPTPKQTLRYYDLSVGYNVFPGEIFLGRNHAKVSALYVIAGLGTTKFDDASHETVNVGAGMRVFLADWSAVQLDVRDHVYSLNLLGKSQTTQNLELSLGLTFFF